MGDVKEKGGAKSVNPPLRDLGLILIKNQHLQHLDLSESNVEPLGLKALAYGLRASLSLKYLSLRCVVTPIPPPYSPLHPRLTPPILNPSPHRIPPPLPPHSSPQREPRGERERVWPRAL